MSARKCPICAVRPADSEFIYWCRWCRPCWRAFPIMVAKSEVAVWAAKRARAAAKRRGK